MTISAKKLTKLLDGKLTGDPHLQLDGACKLDEGGKGKVSFLSNLKYEPQIYNTKADCVIVSNDFKPTSPLQCALISVNDVYQSLPILLDLFDQNKKTNSEISSRAFLDPSAKIGSGVSIGHFSVIESNADIGNDTTIYDQVYIGKNVKIGRGCTIYPGVKIYNQMQIGNEVIVHSNVVIGSDGFGFAPNSDGGYDKVPQIGNVIIKDQVEIGSNTVIDRATMGSTIIEKGVKLDNLVQIAHNVSVGEHTVIAAQTGVAGSTKIGKKCRIGGQVGFVGHISVADNVLIQAKSGVSSSIKKDGQKLYGYPAIGYQNYLRSYAHFKNLGEFVGKIKKMDEELDKIKQLSNQ